MNGYQVDRCWLSVCLPREQHTTTDDAKECQESGRSLGMGLEHKNSRYEHPLANDFVVKSKGLVGFQYDIPMALGHVTDISWPTFNRTIANAPTFALSLRGTSAAPLIPRVVP